MNEPKPIETIEHDDPMRTALEVGFKTGRPMLPEGGELISERSLFGEVITAQPCKVKRDEAAILRRIDVMASAAGENWFYRFPVKDKGRTKYIEGISIDGADAVSRYFGNCRIDAAVVDTGPAWIIYGRFIDLETGYTLIRPFLQSKAGARLGGEDEDRKLSIALGIGTSKSQRNVIDHALRDFTTRAFEKAKENLVERVGQKLDEYRARCVERIRELEPEMLSRVERAYGRASAQWLAPDVARIITELRDIASGMTTPDEAWPLAPPPEPRRSDATEVPAGQEAPSTAGTVGSGPPSTKTAATMATAATGSPSASEPPPAAKNWTVPADSVGQDNFLRSMGTLLDMTASQLEVDELLAANKVRLDKVGAMRRAEWDNKVRVQREVIELKEREP